MCRHFATVDLSNKRPVMMQYDMCTLKMAVHMLYACCATYIARLVHNTALHYSMHADTHLLGSKVQNGFTEPYHHCVTLPLY